MIAPRSALAKMGEKWFFIPLGTAQDLGLMDFLF
jgi:hypothetical protein